MADPLRPGQDHGHLDASGPREVVFCHQCENEWYQDDHSLVCPRCESEITEIITPESDPRPIRNPSPTPQEFQTLRHHNPWAEADSDPEEADIEEHITHGPNGSVFVSRTIRSSGPRTRRGNRRTRGPPDDPNEVMQNFQQMLGTLMGPGLQQGRAGRSGHDDLFPPSPFGGGFRLGGSTGPSVVGGRFTFTTGPGLRPRNGDGPQGAGPPGDDLSAIIENLFGHMTPAPGEDRGAPGMAPVLQGLFASLLNPANARHGDAVYSQEALDQIISTLMEQHPTSNAPGPASADAIAALPKKKIDEKQLGPEGKAECSVCMDDVHMGDEVVLLPCSHWFHEICAGAWLSEHNTCPICRKGIDGDTSSASSRNASPTEPSTRPEYRSRHTHSSDNVHPRGAAASQRNEARLNSIRNTAGLTSSPAERPRRYRVVGDPRGRDEEDYPRMPGSFSRRHSERSGDHHHESRRGHTSGSDASRDSRRSSHSGNAGGSGNGPLSWIRDRFTRHD